MTPIHSAPSPSSGHGRRDRAPRRARPLIPLLSLVVLLAAGLVVPPAVAAADAAGGSACEAPPPPPAAAAGYTELLFCDDFNNPATIDLEVAGCPSSRPCPARDQAGFKWFRAGKPFNYEETPEAGITVRDGVLALDSSTSSNLAILTTYAREGGGFGGFSVKNRGAYFEAAVAFEVPPQSWIDESNPWYAPWRTRGAEWRSGWPSFWSMDTCHLYGRCSPYMELDFFEYLSYPFAGLNSYAGALHRWLDLTLLGKPCNQFGQRPDLPTCHQMEQSNNWSFWHTGFLGERGRRKNSIIEVPEGTDWTGRFNAVGMLLKRGEGLDFYFNNQVYTRNSYAEYPWLAITDHGDFPVILGSKDWPMRVDWVRVWGEAN
jgi:hypothetical protein